MAQFILYSFYHMIAICYLLSVTCFLLLAIYVTCSMILFIWNLQLLAKTCFLSLVVVRLVIFLIWGTLCLGVNTFPNLQAATSLNLPWKSTYSYGSNKFPEKLHLLYFGVYPPSVQEKFTISWPKLLRVWCCILPAKLLILI